jgi:hypothetical protein
LKSINQGKRVNRQSKNLPFWRELLDLKDKLSLNLWSFLESINQGKAAEAADPKIGQIFVSPLL